MANAAAALLISTLCQFLPLRSHAAQTTYHSLISSAASAAPPNNTAASVGANHQQINNNSVDIEDDNPASIMFAPNTHDHQAEHQTDVAESLLENQEQSDHNEFQDNTHAGPKENSKQKWRRGFALLLAVVVIWVISSFMVQFIEGQLAAPFFLTYLGTALFVVLLPVSWATGSLGRILENDRLAARGDARWDRKKASLRETVRGALSMSGFWFLAILTYNASLQYTSVTSSTILSSTSAVFTLVLGALFRVERPTIMHAIGVATCVFGSVLVGLADSGDQDASAAKETFWGDLASLLSAFFYACYTLVIGYHFPNGDESVDMALVFGVVGVANIVLLTPVVIILHTTGYESLAGLTPGIFAFILLQGLLDNVVSDYLWARAVLLTSPTVTTVGLSLTMPLSAALDIVLMSHMPAPLTVLGGLLVTVGFFAVSAKPSQTDADDNVDATLNQTDNGTSNATSGALANA
ncbi:Solute carrier family 35 member F5 [Hondaea fermentalgiana]|uniref:Solute carrier family 35 member F5 n=1 Tax=Hondaea fermentalgiana TaxID=2315210 RepID=A0A2R5GWE6_9STRA|nr:Solute carrier family 35 member F5 [Hondaea fermentalgiana]|eukprot:GBG34088.1 Solute carrier family 35 member F5 [Hondaea fermentalgiana]